MGMFKKICFGEVCKNEEKIHIRTLVLIGLMIAAAITVGIIVYSVVTGTAFLNIPLFPAQY